MGCSESISTQPQSQNKPQQQQQPQNMKGSGQQEAKNVEKKPLTEFCVYVEFGPNPDMNQDDEDFLTWNKEAVAVSIAEPGCLGHCVVRNLENNNVAYIGKFKDANAFKAHQENPDLQAINEKLFPYYDKSTMKKKAMIVVVDEKRKNGACLFLPLTKMKIMYSLLLILPQKMMNHDRKS